jgi:SAM-dependent methyltransferase
MKILLSMRIVWLTSELPILKNKNLVIADIGCGDGQFVEFLASQGFTNVFGIEPDENRANNARLRSVPVYVSSEAFEFKAAHKHGIDVIFIWQVLEHIARPVLFITDHIKQLAPQGVAIISVPNQASIQTRLFGYYSAYPDYGRHIWYHESSYCEWLRTNIHGCDVRIMKNYNFEYEIFSWVDSIASYCTRRQNVIHKILKKGEGNLVAKLTAAIAAAVLTPAACLLACLSLYMNLGSTLTFAITKQRIIG